MKKLLIVVDYQNDFVNGSLGFNKAKEIENNIADKIIKYRNDNDDIIFTYDTHYDNYLNTYEGKHLPVTHCIENTDGHKLYGVIESLKNENDKCFCKNTFGSKDLFLYLLENNYSQIELCGVVTNICVISNAVLAKTAQPEIDIIVDKNCVASNDDTLNNNALDVMKSLHITVI